MHTITARNSSEGLRIAARRLLEDGRIIETRNGPAYTFDAPLMVMFTHPKECFVTDPVRDANPFFALAEAFWLLAGREDTAFLDKYVKTFGERYSDNGILLGSYGKRWRSHFGFDQLTAIVEKLRSDPNTRQAVLQMWEPRDLMIAANDRPCNTAVMFRIRNENLDILITNRSNDIWNGMLAYNPVQFSMLQRVVADQLGIPVGKYWVVSNDAHFYVSDAEVLARRGELTKSMYPPKAYIRIVENTLSWEKELQQVMSHIDKLHDSGPFEIPQMKNSFLSDVVFRVCVGYYHYKQNHIDKALAVVDTVADASWREFCREWLKRRFKNGK